MVLNGRLRLLYDMIPSCDILCDIGTDHALLPAFALLNGRCKKAVACDVGKGPLERAKRTLERFHLQEKMELRLGSGLEPLAEEEADCVVLAGMGGNLITLLLLDSINIARHAKNILLQPMTHQELIRPFLWEHGFKVLDENLTSEGEKIYQAILVHYTGSVRENWDIVDEIIGEHLISKKDPLLKDWLGLNIKRQQRIVGGLSGAMEGREGSRRRRLLQAKELLDKLQNLQNLLYKGNTPGLEEL